MENTPKEKADELVREFMEYTPADMEYEFPYAVECAKIAVEEIIKARTAGSTGVILDGEYWQEVKEELEKM